jgi:recombination protein RecT
MGYKGLIQLAQRSGQYKRLNVIEIYEGELISYNRLTEEIQLNLENKISDKIIGYVAYFQLLNGFEKTVYWSKQQVENHAKKYSKTYNKASGVWKLNFDAMAKKTVLKNMLSKWGILSIDLQRAIQTDQAVINKPIEDQTEITEDDLIYIDNGGGVQDGQINEVTFNVREVSEEIK